MDNEIGLYIHIPFCKSKCHYCDFNSFAGMEENLPYYFDALKREISLYSGKLKKYSIKTAFVGGGTPSLVDTHYIYEVMNFCRQNFNISSRAEISIETNPGTLNYEKLSAYKAIGFNRLSMGLQASQNSLLKFLGRIHSIEEFADNYRDARKVGFKNVNIDLIFGIPGQTLRDWKESLNYVTNLEPAHLSCYSLKIEEGTPFGSMLDRGELAETDDELDREMYRMTIDELEEKGLKHYEISNFAKDGYQCKHNMIYWKAEQYIGLGAGAHSYFEGTRFNNIYGIEEYTSRLLRDEIPAENIQAIGKKDEMSEFIILGLRLIDGVDANEFRARFGEDALEVYGKQLEKLEKRNMITVEDGKIKLTEYGLDVANQVFVEFV